MSRCLVLWSSLIVVLCTPLAAFSLESATLYVTSQSLPALDQNTAQPQPTITVPTDMCIVGGTFSLPDTAIPTINHLALYTSKGQSLPLIIDRSSLVYQADQIIALRFLFLLPRQYDQTQPLKLVWSSHSGQLAQNREVPVFSLDPDSREQLFGSRIEISSDKPAGSTVLIEIDPKQQLYKLWYLFPLGVLLLCMVLPLLFRERQSL